MQDCAICYISSTNSQPCFDSGQKIHKNCPAVKKYTMKPIRRPQVHSLSQQFVQTMRENIAVQLTLEGRLLPVTQLPSLSSVMRNWGSPTFSLPKILNLSAMKFSLAEWCTRFDIYYYLYLADVWIIQHPTNVAYQVGQDAALSCSVTNPDGITPSLIWYKVVGDASTVLDTSLVNFDFANPGTSTLTFLKWVWQLITDKP